MERVSILLHNNDGIVIFGERLL